MSPSNFRAGLALGLLLVGGGALAGSADITCCEEASGRRICADVLPPSCYGREYRLISPQGTVTRRVPAPPTAEERARAEQEEKARKTAEGKAREARRKDMALLQTYTSLEDLEAQHQRAMADLEHDLEDARQGEAEALRRRAALDREAEFYPKKSLPSKLANDLIENDGELAAQRSVIASKQRDLEAVKARYESERRRYAELMAEKGQRR